MNDWYTILEAELKTKGFLAMIQYATFLVRTNELTMSSAIRYIQEVSRNNVELVPQDEDEDA